MPSREGITRGRSTRAGSAWARVAGPPRPGRASGGLPPWGERPDGVGAVGVPARSTLRSQLPRGKLIEDSRDVVGNLSGKDLP